MISVTYSFKEKFIFNLNNFLDVWLQYNISLKMHFLHPHQIFFKENIGAVRDEYDDHLRQEIS